MMIHVQALETGSFYYITICNPGFLTTCGPWDDHPRVRMSCSQLDLSAFRCFQHRLVRPRCPWAAWDGHFSSWSVPLVETHKRPWYCDSERFVDFWRPSLLWMVQINSWIHRHACMQTQETICTESLHRFQHFKVTAAFCHAEYHRDHIRFPLLWIPSHQGQYQLVGKAGNVQKKIKRLCI